MGQKTWTSRGVQKGGMTDTEPKIQIKLTAMMKQKTGVERLKMGLSMFDFSKRLVVASIIAAGHGADIRRQLLLRFYQSDLEPDTINRMLTKKF